jgi:hypothetical protein
MKIYCAWCGVHFDSMAVKYYSETTTYWDDTEELYKDSVYCPVCGELITKDTGELV